MMSFISNFSIFGTFFSNMTTNDSCQNDFSALSKLQTNIQVMIFSSLDLKTVNASRLVNKNWCQILDRVEIKKNIWNPLIVKLFVVKENEETDPNLPDDALDIIRKFHQKSPRRVLGKTYNVIVIPPIDEKRKCVSLYFQKILDSSLSS